MTPAAVKLHLVLVPNPPVHEDGWLEDCTATFFPDACFLTFCLTSCTFLVIVTMHTRAHTPAKLNNRFFIFSLKVT